MTIHIDAAQAIALEHLREQFNAACDFISAVAWREHEWNAYRLQRLVYGEVREHFELLSQYTIRAIAVVAHTYKVDKTTCHTFRKDAAVVLDTPRLYSLNDALTQVSIATLDGRIVEPLAISGKQREQLRAARKLAEADLLRDEHGRWRLRVCAHYADPAIEQPTDVLGVDMGIVNIAADSDGTLYAGSALIGLRIRHRRLRKRLQAKGTKSTRRKLRVRRRKERRFAANTNHVISKRIVTVAKGTCRAIAIEELGGIRERVSVRAHQRVTLHSWSFDQLRHFIEYKARMAGILVIPVDPRNSSRTCPVCDFVSRANRRSQARFSCQQCGFSGHADLIAATNLRARGRAAVMPPNVSEAMQPSLVGGSQDVCIVAPGTSPRL